MKHLLFAAILLFSTIGFSQTNKPVEVKYDSTYAGPRLASGSKKFVGNLKSRNESNFSNLWNQLTPENEGKWEQVGISPDTTKWDWTRITKLYNYAKANKMQFKFHTLIWGRQQPAWISDLPPNEQLNYITYWIKEVGRRFPDAEMVDVVNESLGKHWPPDGRKETVNYINALGGTGKTGYDWVLKSFELARKYMPKSKLILNDYSILNNDSNTTAYLEIINVLQARKLIDGIGIQAHRFEITNPSPQKLKANLDRLAATGLPIYLSEVDLGPRKDNGDANDAEQLELYQTVFPVLWEHPAVAGITFWGYVEGKMWIKNCHLVRADGTWRPAMIWLADYLAKNELRLPAVLSNNMVIQQDMQAVLWGWASPNESVEITASWRQTANAKADATGKWTTKIQTPKAIPGDNQTKHTLTFKGKNNSITLTNILIGDVYLCSGQSNMQFNMSRLIDAEKEIAAANYPNIRINLTGFSKEIIPVEYNKGDWSECSPTSVSKFSAVAYYFARQLHTNSNINIPIGLVQSAVGGSGVQSWMRREALAADPVLKSNVLDPYDQHPTMAFKTASSILYNAMIAPLVPFSVKGFLWYQGEANNQEENYRDSYSKLLSTLITDWRTLWGQGDIPFYFVQLPAHNTMSPELRNQQSNTLTVPNTGMAVTLDLADADLSDIHPHNKKDVGIRLAKIAEAKIYNQNVVFAGPMIKSFLVKGDKIRIKFQAASIGSGLASRDGQALNHFEIAGSDNKFVPATAVIVGNDVVVSSPSVKKPVNVAFAYISKAIPNLMNKDGLTACPFRTDTWNYAITLSNKNSRK